MRRMNSRTHGVIDYAYDLVFLLAPSVFGFSPVVSAICYTVAALHFLTCLFTQYEYSLVKAIPFPVHGTMELIASILFVVLPWIAGFSAETAARNFFLVAGIALFAVWMTTNYRSTTSSILESTREHETRLRRVG